MTRRGSIKQLLNYIQAQDFNDAWFKVLWEIWEQGRSYEITQGSYQGEKRISLDCALIEIDYPASGNLLPVLSDRLKQLAPLDAQQAENYAVQYILGAEVAENETYTYGSRINQSLQEVIDRFNQHGAGTNQCILQIGDPNDITCEDPPCLRHIDIKIIGDTLNFYLYFRSWEAFAGLPTNLAGIKYLLDYLIENIKLPGGPERLMPGKFICHSKCLHIYSHMLDVVDQILGFPHDRRSKAELLRNQGFRR